jgi:hypothetical protein
VEDGRLDIRAKGKDQRQVSGKKSATNAGSKGSRQVLSNTLPVEHMVTFRLDSVFCDIITESTHGSLNDIGRQCDVLFAFQDEIGMACLDVHISN